MAEFSHYEVDALGVRATHHHRCQTLGEAFGDALARCCRPWDEATVYGVGPEDRRTRLAVAGCGLDWAAQIFDVRGPVPVQLTPPFDGA